MLILRFSIGGIEVVTCYRPRIGVNFQANWSKSLSMLEWEKDLNERVDVTLFDLQLQNEKNILGSSKNAIKINDVISCFLKGELNF